MESIDALLERLFVLGAEPLADLSLRQWKQAFDSEKSRWESAVDQALMGGALADRTAYAFSAGYLSALRVMFPSYPHTGFSSLCVSEEAGNHPKAIQTTLCKVHGGWVLNGTKTFVTGGCEAEQLFIAATTDETVDGRAVIKMVCVTTGQPGMAITELPTLPFVPEISHAQVSFTNASVIAEAILPGDGYSDYVKIFRTIEDVHVSMAVLGYLTRTGISLQWSESLIEQLLSTLLSHRQLGLMDPKKSSTHLALSGAKQTMERLLQQVDQEWEATDAKSFALWERDKALLKIAAKAGAKRRENAWALYR